MISLEMSDMQENLKLCESIGKGAYATTLNASLLREGIYFLKITMLKREVLVEKVIKEYIIF